MDTTEARRLLAEQGFFTENLWHVIDVTGTYDCTDEQAQQILKDALTNDYVMSAIWDTIDSIAEDLNLEKEKNQ
jgi:hypothetical protein